MNAVLGVLGAQTPWNRGRGIARYIAEHARALAVAGAVTAIDVDAALPAPAFVEGLPAAVFRNGGGKPPPPAALYHVMSPFEEVPVGRVWPVWARRPDVALVVTLYDLIPMQEPDAYLVTDWLRAYYAARLELVRSADAVLAISAATAADAVARLGIEADRVHVISTGASELFTPPPRGTDPAGAARTAVPGLRDGFLLYVGGLDARKNVDRLLDAYAALPDAGRRRAQLVVACPPDAPRERALRQRCAALGVGRDVVLTGFVSDQLLLTLYRACRALVLPSLTEGFGLPVIEAMRSGAAAVVSDIPSLVELVGDADARFDPRSLPAITAVLARVIDDPAFVERLRALGRRLAGRYTWPGVAESSIAGYAAALARRAAITRSRKAS